MDEQMMQFALELAVKAEGQTCPNPLVGAVIVSEHKIVGYGSHLKAGGKHAEVHAIEMAGEKTKGATLYVTLEPCSHVGKTPPCTELIIKSGIKRVVIAARDPHEKVNGINRLMEAGIVVMTGVLEEKSLSINHPYFHYIKTKKPFVTLKTAMSLDGKIATKTGESQWITNEKSRDDGHTYRQSHDAILVGVNTVLTDNPLLTARTANGPIKQPTRIVLDTNLRTPLQSNVIVNHEAKTWIFVGQSVTAERINEFEAYNHVSIIQINSNHLQVDRVLTLLGEENIMSLLVEGGAKVSSSFLTQTYPNQLIVYIAPVVIGGEKASSPFSGHGFAKLNDARKVTIDKIEHFDGDVKMTAHFKKEENDVHRYY